MELLQLISHQMSALTANYRRRPHDPAYRGDVPFLLEFIGYDPSGGDEKGHKFAQIKPQVVIKSIAEFSKPHYGVDVLKIEFPINLRFVEGSKFYCGQKAQSLQEALKLIREASDTASRPFVYLSAGVDNDVFIEQLEIAGESGSDYSGVLCGRATWKEGIPVYAKHGVKALEIWLRDEGVRNIAKVNHAIRTAKPWWKKMGLAQAPQ